MLRHSILNKYMLKEIQAIEISTNITIVGIVLAMIGIFIDYENLLAFGIGIVISGTIITIAITIIIIIIIIINKKV